VPFGRLMEHTREALADAGRITPWWQRAAMRVLGHHRALLAGSTLLAFGQRLHLVPKRLVPAPVPLRRGTPLRSTGTDVWLFTGCVMDAWQRDAHRATAAVVTATGATFAIPESGGDCCGALHVHAGLHDEASALARRVMASMPGDAPILVDSAGCGAAMKDYGHLLGTPDAVAFAARVRDVHEWVAERLDRLPVARRRAGAVAVQDPCHLRHVQRVHGAVRTVLAHVADVVELDDEGLCCGAGGAYSALEPELAGLIRDRKVASIDRAMAAGATVVASANPGCSMHLAGAGVAVRHPMEIVAEAIA
jgi:glycolate oxidase iron-sulfur subunit